MEYTNTQMIAKARRVLRNLGIRSGHVTLQDTIICDNMNNTGKGIEIEFNGTVAREYKSSDHYKPVSHLKFNLDKRYGYWGGKRNGAGRKPSAEPKTKTSVYLTASTIAKLKSIDPNVSAAIEKLTAAAE